MLIQEGAVALVAGLKMIVVMYLRVALGHSPYRLAGQQLDLWSYTDLADPRWTIGAKYIQLKQVTNPKGRFKEQMSGIYNPSGWGAYFRGGNLFVKRSTVQREAEYPDFGCNFEINTEPGFLELETLGPLQTLAPGETVEHTEEWWLFRGIPAGDDDTWIDNIILPIVETATG